MTSVANGALSNFGPYRVLTTIARGGMGFVHLAAVRSVMSAASSAVPTFVVIKEMLPPRGEDERDDGSSASLAHSMFLQESTLAVRIVHPNIVRTLDMGMEGDSPYMVLEYLDGQPLNRIRLKVDAEHSRAHQLRVLSEVLAALHYAHNLCDENGAPLSIVHRDVSPNNIFVSYTGATKLLDFGIAKAAHQMETRVGTVKGRLTYMAPEQARGEKLDRRADVFAVGILVWEAIVGKRLWENVNEIVALGRLVRGDLPNFRAPFEGGDPTVLAMVERALSPKRDDRFATADEFRLALDAYRATLGPEPGEGELGKLLVQTFTADIGKRDQAIQSALQAIGPNGLAEGPPILREWILSSQRPSPRSHLGARAKMEESGAAFHALVSAPISTWGIGAGSDPSADITADLAFGPTAAHSSHAVAASLTAELSHEMSPHTEADVSDEHFSVLAKWVVIGLFVFCLVVLLGAIGVLVFRTH